VFCFFVRYLNSCVRLASRHIRNSDLREMGHMVLVMARGRMALGMATKIRKYLKIRLRRRACKSPPQGTARHIRNSDLREMGRMVSVLARAAFHRMPTQQLPWRKAGRSATT